MTQLTSQSHLAFQGGFVVSVAPDRIRKALDTNEMADLWIGSFTGALANGRRDAHRLYCELLGMVGAQDRALEVALRAIGVSLEAARIAVGAYQQVQGMDADQAADFSLARLQEHYAARGESLILVPAGKRAVLIYSGDENGASADDASK